MALFKLLFSILLFSFVYSAPVEVPTGIPNEGHDPVATISDLDKDKKPSTQSDAPLSTGEVPAILPMDGNNEGESPPSESPLIGNSDPSSNPKVDSQAPDSIKQQRTPNDNNEHEQGSNPANESPTDTNQKDDAKPLPDGGGGNVREPMDPSAQQPGDPFINDRIPVMGPNPFEKDSSTVPGESDVPPQITDEDPPQGPYEDGTLGQASEPFNEKGVNEGSHIYPEPPIEAETINQEKVVYPPFKFPPDSDAAKQTTSESAQKDSTEIQNEPLDNDRLNSKLPQGLIGSKFPQEPMGSEHQQEPMGSEHQQDPMGSENPQEPMGSEHPQEPMVSELPQESVGSELLQEPMGSELLQEPMGSELPQEPMGSELPQELIGGELPQDEAKEPIGGVQPEDIGPPFENDDDSTVESEDNSRLPTPDQSDRPDEEDPPFPVNVDGPEEMVGDPVELPMKEEVNPPAVLVRDDLVPSVVSVIQIEQQAPPYLNRENVPLSEDSVGGEMPEEEVSNPDNTEPGMLSFDNRPEESGPMNIL